MTKSLNLVEHGVVVAVIFRGEGGLWREPRTVRGEGVGGRGEIAVEGAPRGRGGWRWNAPRYVIKKCWPIMLDAMRVRAGDRAGRDRNLSEPRLDRTGGGAGQGGIAGAQGDEGAIMGAGRDGSGKMVIISMGVSDGGGVDRGAGRNGNLSEPRLDRTGGGAGHGGIAGAQGDE